VGRKRWAKPTIFLNDSMNCVNNTRSNFFRSGQDDKFVGDLRFFTL